VEVVTTNAGPVLVAGEHNQKRVAAVGGELFPFEGRKRPLLSILTLNLLKWISGSSIETGFSLPGVPVTVSEDVTGATAFEGEEIPLLSAEGEKARYFVPARPGLIAIKGAQRARLEAASSYLDVAPMVVKVAHDAPVPDVGTELPTVVADPELLGRLAEDYGLTSSFKRVLTALNIA
jgi:hypothetical protein